MTTQAQPGQPCVDHANAPPTSPWWRPDVQGLRAVAVLGVVIYHSGLPLKGGFTGVDVFFVISGFVIGGLLLRELRRTNGFSPSAFYLRRARRILPAAALMIVITVLLSTVLLSPLGTSQQDAGHAASAASVFLANLYFFLSGGYFQPSHDANPFLHTWSLSVEEQFYFLLPWLLVIGWKMARRSGARSLIVLLIIAWLTSFAACVVFTFHLIPASVPVIGPRFAEYPGMATLFAFFSPVTRSWEFLTGLLVALITATWAPRRGLAEALACSGIVVILVGYVMIPEGEGFPGWRALLPVLGAAAVLVAGQGGGRAAVSRALSVRPMVRIGDWSYSWYLWHWPLVVFAALWFDTLTATMLAAFGSLLPAVISYVLVERPIHRRRWIGSNRAMAWTALGLIVIPLLSGVSLARAWSQGWWQPEVRDLQQATSVLHADTTLGCADISGIGPGSGSCVFDHPGSRGTVLLIGDSNAGMYVEPLVEATKALGLNLEVATRNACPVQVGLDLGTQACKESVAAILQTIAVTEPPYAAVVVVNSGKYAAPTDGASDMAAPTRAPDAPQRAAEFAGAVRKAAEEIDSPVLVIEPIPQGEGGTFPRCLLPSVLSSISTDCGEFSAGYVTITRTEPVAALENALSGVATTYDPSSLLCQPDGTCSMFRDGRLVYRDDSHLSVEGSLLFTDGLQEALRRTLADSRERQ